MKRLQSNNRTIKQSNNFSCGFTLVEMLVVIGIIAVLIGVAIPSFSYATKAANQKKSEAVVTETATALKLMLDKEKTWPPLFENLGEGGDHQLDERTARVLAKKGYLPLTLESGKLAGLDQFGVVTPWAMEVIKRQGRQATLQAKVGACTVQDHILHFAIDADKDGVVEGVSVGGETMDIYGSAVVWSIGKSGGDSGKPWPYTKGLRKDDAYSWSRDKVKKNK